MPCCSAPPKEDGAKPKPKSKPAEADAFGLNEEEEKALREANSEPEPEAVAAPSLDLGPARERTWAELTEDELEAAECLSWSEADWDTKQPSPIALVMSWAKLNRMQKRWATALSYDAESWDESASETELSFKAAKLRDIRNHLAESSHPAFKSLQPEKVEKHVWKLPAGGEKAEDEHVMTQEDHATKVIVDKAIILLYSSLASSDAASRFFREVDADGNATLEVDEILLLFKKLGMKLSIKQAAGVLQKLDTDGDGVVTMSEFVDRVFMCQIGVLRSRFRALSYVEGGQDWAALFRYYDRDNSGSLEFDEFRKAVRKDAKILGGLREQTSSINDRHITDTELRRMFDFIDSDHNGTLDVEEFSSFLATGDDEHFIDKPISITDSIFEQILLYLDLKKLKMSDAFAQMDKDGNGTLDRKEFQQAMKSIGIELGQEECRIIFISLDRNGDGDVGFDEFMLKARETRKAMRARERREQGVVQVAPMAGSDNKRCASPRGRGLYGKSVNIFGEDKRNETQVDQKKKRVELVQRVFVHLQSSCNQQKMLYGQRLMDGLSCFVAFDRDNSGNIDNTQLKNGMQRLGFELTMHQAGIVTTEIDEEGMLDQDKFIEELRKVESVVPAPISRGASSGFARLAYGSNASSVTASWRFAGRTSMRSAARASMAVSRMSKQNKSAPVLSATAVADEKPPAETEAERRAKELKRYSAQLIRRLCPAGGKFLDENKEAVFDEEQSRILAQIKIIVFKANHKHHTHVMETIDELTNDMCKDDSGTLTPARELELDSCCSIGAELVDILGADIDPGH